MSFVTTITTIIQWYETLNNFMNSENWDTKKEEELTEESYSERCHEPYTS